MNFSVFVVCSGVFLKAVGDDAVVYYYRFIFGGRLPEEFKYVEEFSSVASGEPEEGGGAKSVYGMFSPVPR